MPLDKNKNIFQIPKGTKAHRWRNIFIFGGLAYTVIGFAIAAVYLDRDNNKYQAASDRFEARQVERRNRLEQLVEKRKQQAALRDEPYEDSSTIMGGGRGLGRG